MLGGAVRLACIVPRVLAYTIAYRLGPRAPRLLTLCPA